MKKKIIISFIILISVLLLNLIFKKEEKNKIKPNDKISILIEKDTGNEKVDAFPDKEIYYYDRIECNKNDNTIIVPEFDDNNWKLNFNVSSVKKLDGKLYCSVYFKVKPVFNYEYKGESQTFTAPITGTYKIELWGAGLQHKDNIDNSDYFVLGSYVSGNIKINKNENFYIYVGQSSSKSRSEATFNGGGTSTLGTYGKDEFNRNYNQNYAGSGATDIRIVNGLWNNKKSLRSRIMVAAGSSLLAGGGIISQDSTSSCINTPYVSYKATQTAAGKGVNGDLEGSFGIGGDGEVASIGYGSNGGGGGYFGGAGGYASEWNGDCLYERSYAGMATSGSSYISGHTGCVSIISESNDKTKEGCTSGSTNYLCSVHHSEKTFTNTVMIDGNKNNWTNVKGKTVEMPSPSPSKPLAFNNGHAKITFIKK